MSDQFVEAVIQAGGGAIVDGHAIDTAATPDPYTAIYRHVATLAREDEAVLVRGVDRTQGSDVAWFTVDARGHATAATAPDAGGRRLAEGPADSPTDEAGAGLTAGEPGASGGVRSRPSPVTTARTPTA